MTNSGSPASSVDIVLLCAGALHGVAEQLLPAFERAYGQRVAVRFASSGGVRQRILDGEAADVAISTEVGIAELARQRKILPDSATAVARSAIGVAVRAGAAKPDISSLDAFKQTLLAARSLAYADPATGSPSGTHLVKLFEQLGITAALAPKTRLVGGGAGQVVVVGDVIASGEAELGLQQISEILGVPGIALAGPLPPGAQHITVFSAAIPAVARDPAGARLLIDFLTSPDNAAVLVGRLIQTDGYHPFGLHH